MVKRTLLSEFKVQRYSKPITCMKLKDDDEVVTITNNSGPAIEPLFAKQIVVIAVSSAEKKNLFILFICC